MAHGWRERERASERGFRQVVAGRALGWRTQESRRHYIHHRNNRGEEEGPVKVRHQWRPWCIYPLSLAAVPSARTCRVLRSGRSDEGNHRSKHQFD